MAKKTRTEPQREGTLRLLAQLMKGRTHTATSAAKELTMNREGALRVLKALHKHVPGIQKNDSSQPHVFSFSTKE
ncbi:MAG: hypothetical protein KC492_15595, partial [Myxococcales bacterium]|nr:hypothetical protein [Myxococcales bacterium]